jgi:hypothetical protein
VIYLCCDERRRNAVRAFAGLNGIDFLEVVDNDAASSAERQRSLRIHFLKSPAPPNIQPAKSRSTAASVSEYHGRRRRL